MKKDTILGICIPTYNRAQWLERNVLNLIDLINEYEIPIYISDNCSTDDTKERIEKLKEKYKHIIYSCNEENLGSDRNFEKVLKMCETDYAWLLGDDDTILRLDNILDVLYDYSPDVLYLGEKEKGIHEGIYTDKQYIFNNISHYISWMSGMIVSRNIIENVDFERYFGTYFVHVGIVLDYLGRFDMSMYYMHNTHVTLMREGYSAYHDLSFEIYAKGWVELVIKLPYFSYDEKVKYLIKRRKIFGMFGNKILLSLRGQKIFNIEKLKEYKEYIKMYNHSPIFFLALIAVFPTQLAYLIRIIYKKIILKHHKETIIEHVS